MAVGSRADAAKNSTPGALHRTLLPVATYVSAGSKVGDTILALLGVIHPVVRASPETNVETRRHHGAEELRDFEAAVEERLLTGRSDEGDVEPGEEL